MVAGVKAKLSVSLSGKQISTNDIGSPGMPFDIEKVLEFTPGTDAKGKANVLFMDTRSLTSAQTETLDMSGVLVDAFGVTIAAAEIVMIYIEAPDTNTVGIDFFGGASNPFNGPLSGTTPKLRLLPGEFVVLSSKEGWAVTAATGDLLSVTNLSAVGTYKIAIFGRTVAA